MRDKEIEEENRRIRRVRFIVDLTEAVLQQSLLSPDEIYRLLNNTKKAVLNLFPDKEEVYELIYTPRFQRIIAEKFTVPGSFSGKN